jgi:hypothetical protein
MRLRLQLRLRLRAFEGTGRWLPPIHPTPPPLPQPPPLTRCPCRPCTSADIGAIQMNEAQVRWHPRVVAADAASTAAAAEAGPDPARGSPANPSPQTAPDPPPQEPVSPTATAAPGPASDARQPVPPGPVSDGGGPRGRAAVGGRGGGGAAGATDSFFEDFDDDDSDADTDDDLPSVEDSQAMKDEVGCGGRSAAPHVVGECYLGWAVWRACASMKCSRIVWRALRRPPSRRPPIFRPPARPPRSSAGASVPVDEEHGFGAQGPVQDV